MSRSPVRRRVVAGAGALALVGAGAGALLGPGASTASSHREAPLVLNDPQIDNTDTYAFVSPDAPDTVTLIANWIPFEDPAGGPNFYPWATSDSARYNINIDNNGDALPDVVYRWTFTNADARGTDTFLYANGPVDSLDDENLLFKQTYKLEEIKGDQTRVLVDGGKVAPSHVGEATMPNYAALRDEAVAPVEGGGKSYVGQADDPFFLDLRVFDLLYGGDLSETGNDTLSGYNVNSVALQVPKAALAAAGDAAANPVIGVWSTTDRASMRVQNADGTQAYSGDFVQVSRLGMPLVNEVVIPAGLKDAFNALTPDKDATVQAAVDKVNDPEVPKLIEAIYGIEAPAAPRDDIFAIYLTGVEGLNTPALNAAKAATLQPSEMIRLNTSIAPVATPNRLGVLAKETAGFPNGRRLQDDVVDISLQALEGAVRTGVLVEALAAGDGVNENDLEFGTTFPYLALPHSGSEVRATSVAGASGAASESGAGSGTGAGTGAGTGSGTAAAPSGGVATGAGGLAGGLPAGAVAAALAGLVLAGAGVLVLRRSAA